MTKYIDLEDRISNAIKFLAFLAQDTSLRRNTVRLTFSDFGHGFNGLLCFNWFWINLYPSKVVFVVSVFGMSKFHIVSLFTIKITKVH